MKRTASVQHAIRAPLHARFKDLPTSDMKEILLQRLLEENYDKGHEDHKMAFEALQKSIIRDESEKFDADKAEERTKKKSKQDSPKTPHGSPPPPPPPSGASGASCTKGTSDSTQDPPPPPPSSTTNRGDKSQSSTAPGSSKTTALTEYTAWTTTTSRLKPAASSVPEDVLMHEESDFEAQDMGSDDEDSGSRHIPKVSLNHEWFKPLSEKERPATPEPAWSIPSSSLSVPNHNWASALASSFVPPPKNSLLLQTGPVYEVVKAFHPDVIHLQFQMEECHKLLTNQVDEGLLRYNVSRPLPLGGPPGQVMIQTKFFFNKDLEYLRFGHKGDRLALSITKMKAASYPDAGLEQMVPDQMWVEEEYMYDISASYGISHWCFKRHQFYIERHSADTNRRAIVRTHMRILSVIRIEVFSLYGYDFMKKIVLRRADNQEYTIAESDFKDLYPSDFEDLYLLNLQGKRLPAQYRELPDSAKPHQTSLGSYRSRVHWNGYSRAGPKRKPNQARNGKDKVKGSSKDGDEDLQHSFRNSEKMIKRFTLDDDLKNAQRSDKPKEQSSKITTKDIVNTIVNSSMDIASVNVHECEKCRKLETELLNKKDFVEKEIYDKLFKSFTTLEKHCISLEVDTQLNLEIFQRDNSVSNQSAPSFDQLFELNELKAQS
ncbi:hypothetical protein Tco_0942553 [Tanacetum coccineum]